MQKSLCANFSAFVVLPEATEMTSSKIRFPAELSLFLPLKNLAHIHIHVIFHLEVRVPVACDLDDRGDG